ncbi:hypothetical protein LXL04_037913 [Taraxacum kok-saghyz]
MYVFKYLHDINNAKIFKMFLSSAEVDVNEYRTYNRDVFADLVLRDQNFGGNAMVHLVFTSSLLLTNVEAAPEEDFALLGHGEAPLEEDFITSFLITNALNLTIYGYSSRFIWSSRSQVNSGPRLEFHRTFTIGMRLCLSLLTSRSKISTGSSTKLRFGLTCISSKGMTRDSSDRHFFRFDT